VRRGAWLAAGAFVLTWVPISLWRGIAFGRTFRIGAEGQDSLGPVVEGVIQMAAIMFAPALFVALLVFVGWAYREERRARRPRP
jgi:hypothetical protein